MQSVMKWASPSVELAVLLETHEEPLQVSVAKENISEVVKQLKLGGWQIISGLDNDMAINTDRVVAFWWQ